MFLFGFEVDQALGRQAGIQGSLLASGTQEVTFLLGRKERATKGTMLNLMSCWVTLFPLFPA